MDENKINDVVFAIESLLFSHNLTVNEHKRILEKLEKRLDNAIGQAVVLLNKDELLKCK